MNDQEDRSLFARIEEICDSFEKAWKSGRRPDLAEYVQSFPASKRKELLEELMHVDLVYRFREGEEVVADDYESLLPDATEIFAEIVKSLAIEETHIDISQSDTHRKSRTKNETSRSEENRALKRYSILRHHASGGLGDVFIARDEELNREVALKEIKGEFSHDENNRNRFVMEAEITGRLEHPGIVPVYGMGKHDDGRPYYAMRFIKGESLWDAIRLYHRENKTDHSKLELRKLLRRFCDVCNAVEYAHSRGIVHRDLKPQNIMLGKFGETLVVDWGLAKPVGRKDKTKDPTDEGTLRISKAGDSTTETRQGDVVGTLQFMSPEQAAGKIDELGPTSDIYSLGAVLFCILSGKAPFEESRSEGMDNLLIDVREGEFLPPRHIDPRIAKSIERIVLKAMQKLPHERYLSAKDLADDVERYLADEPVEAYRDPIVTRIARWSRKHKVIFSSAIVLLITSVIALTASNLVIADAHSETRIQKERAERNGVLARQAVDTILKTVKNSELQYNKKFKQLIGTLLKDTLEYYQVFVEEYRDDEDKIEELAKALAEIGEINDIRGDNREAIKALSQAVDLYRQLSQAEVKADQRVAFSSTLLRLGSLLVETHQFDEAEKTFLEGFALTEELARKFPDNPEYRNILGKIHLGRGKLLLTLDRQDQAMNAFREALRINSQLTDRFPISTQTLGYYNDTAICYLSYGHVLRDQLDHQQALLLFRKARSIWLQLLQEDESVTEFQHSVSMAEHNIGLTLLDLKQEKAAVKTLESAVKTIESLSRNDPLNREFKEDSVGFLLNLANARLAARDLDRAFRDLQKLTPAIELLVREEPDNVELKRKLLASYNTMASYYGLKDRHKLAAVEIGKAITVSKNLAARYPEVPIYRSSLATIFKNLGINHVRNADLKQAQKAYKDAIAILEPLAKENPKNRWYSGQLKAAKQLQKMAPLHVLAAKFQNASKKLKRKNTKKHNNKPLIAPRPKFLKPSKKQI